MGIGCSGGAGGRRQAGWLTIYTTINRPPQMKIRALKQTILLLLSGESLPRVLMSVIRFCSNTDDHMLKKLLMLYWEVRVRLWCWLHGDGLRCAVRCGRLTNNPTPNLIRWCPSTTAPPKSCSTR